MQLYTLVCFQCDAHSIRFVPFERTHKRVAASNTEVGEDGRELALCLDGSAFNLSMLGFDFYIDVLDLICALRFLTSKKKSLDLSILVCTISRQTSVISIVDLYKRKQVADFDLFLSLY